MIFLALRRGATGVSMVSNILVAHVFIGLWMLYLLVSRRWPELLAAQPADASPDPLWNYTTGVELGIGATLSWWPYIGAMIRMAPNGRTIVLPVMLGMAAPVPSAEPDRPRRLAGAQVLRSVGMAAHRRRPDLCDRLAELRHRREFWHDHGRHLRLGDRTAQLRGLATRSWTTLLLITIAPVALVGIFIPELFFAKFGNFLALIGVAFAPLCGIQIVDYFVLRRGRIDIRAIYDGSPSDTPTTSGAASILPRLPP